MSEPDIHISFNSDVCFDKRHLLYKITDHIDARTYIYDIFERGSADL